MCHPVPILGDSHVKFFPLLSPFGFYKPSMIKKAADLPRASFPARSPTWRWCPDWGAQGVPAVRGWGSNPPPLFLRASVSLHPAPLPSPRGPPFPSSSIPGKEGSRLPAASTESPPQASAASFCSLCFPPCLTVSGGHQRTGSQHPGATGVSPGRRGVSAAPPGPLHRLSLLCWRSPGTGLAAGALRSLGWSLPRP